MIPTKSFHSVPITTATANDAVDLVIDRALNGPPTTFRLVNAGTFDAAVSVPEYMEILRGDGVNLPDGRPLSLVLQRTRPRNRPVEQVRGPWLFETVLDRGRSNSLRHFLLGASEQTLRKLEDAIERKFPGTLIVGTYSPPFRTRTEEELAHADEVVIRSEAHIVWVALGTPKQDAEALRILRAVGVTTAAVGAAFDFTAETKKPAPRLVRKLGLEWMFRLLSEPKRLWRRYLIGNSRFIYLSAVHLRNRS